ncbi:MAG: hypothetical protein M3467_03075 [Actinomycetota bacterium]|nr:hypothetical protein [Actinomycetota bacterium]
MRVLRDRLLASGRVELFSNCEYVDDRQVVSCISGERFEVPESCRIVDARYLSPDIPADTPPPFRVADGVHVIPVNDLAVLDHAPSQYVIVGSGKTATDACVWLLGRGVDPDAICWVRPRDPWLLNRNVVQPDPAVFLGMAAGIMQAAAAASSLHELFLRLEDAHHAAHRPVGDPDDGEGAHDDHLGARPAAQHRARRTTRAHPARRAGASHPRGGLGRGGEGRGRGALRGVRPAKPAPRAGLAPVGDHPAADSAGFPCFGAALVGYVEATRSDDEQKNRLCPPTPYGNTLADWAAMNVRGTRATASSGSERCRRAQGMFHVC